MARKMVESTYAIPYTKGGLKFLKIQRTLAILWLGTFIAGPCYWLWEFLNNVCPGCNGIHALFGLLCLFGAVASIFLFQDAKWARISIGFLALFFGFGALWEIWQQGWMWTKADKWACDGLFVFSLVTIVLLFFRRYEPGLL
jgi:hypothetical protein